MALQQSALKQVCPARKQLDFKLRGKLKVDKETVYTAMSHGALYELIFFT